VPGVSGRTAPGVCGFPAAREVGTSSGRFRGRVPEAGGSGRSRGRPLDTSGNATGRYRALKPLARGSGGRACLSFASLLSHTRGTHFAGGSWHRVGLRVAWPYPFCSPSDPADSSWNDTTTQSARRTTLTYTRVAATRGLNTYIHSPVRVDATRPPESLPPSLINTSHTSSSSRPSSSAESSRRALCVNRIRRWAARRRILVKTHGSHLGIACCPVSRCRQAMSWSGRCQAGWTVTCVQWGKATGRRRGRPGRRRPVRRACGASRARRRGGRPAGR